MLLATSDDLEHVGIASIVGVAGTAIGAFGMWLLKCTRLRADISSETRKEAITHWQGMTDRLEATLGVRNQEFIQLQEKYMNVREERAQLLADKRALQQDNDELKREVARLSSGAS